MMDQDVLCVFCIMILIIAFTCQLIQIGQYSDTDDKYMLKARRGCSVVNLIFLTVGITGNIFVLLCT